MILGKTSTVETVLGMQVKVLNEHGRLTPTGADRLIREMKKAPGTVYRMYGPECYFLIESTVAGEFLTTVYLPSTEATFCLKADDLRVDVMKYGGTIRRVYGAL